MILKTILKVILKIEDMMQSDDLQGLPAGGLHLIVNHLFSSNTIICWCQNLSHSLRWKSDEIVLNLKVILQICAAVKQSPRQLFTMNATRWISDSRAWCRQIHSLGQPALGSGAKYERHFDQSQREISCSLDLRRCRVSPVPWANSTSGRRNFPRARWRHWLSAQVNK